MLEIWHCCGPKGQRSRSHDHSAVCNIQTARCVDTVLLAYEHLFTFNKHSQVIILHFTNFTFYLQFLRASAILKHVIDIGWTSVCLSVRPSVRPSHAGIVSKRPIHSSFVYIKIFAKFRRGHPLRER